MKKSIFLLILILSLFFQTKAFTNKSDSSQAKKDQKALQHEVTVTLKLVQVYVTDKKGGPITDLTKVDFILYDNGKLQTITDFEKHNLALPKKKTEKKIKEKLEETELAPSKKIPSRMNRKFFLLLDCYQNDASGVSKSKKAALHFINTQLQPTDEVGVLSYSQDKGVILNEYLTNDHKEAREAVKNIKGIPGDVFDSLDDDPPTEAEYEYIKMKSRKFAADMQEFAKALRYIPGYKNIILFSGGVSRALFSDEDAWEDALGVKKTDLGLRVAYEEMSKEFGASNSPVYTVNTKGLRGVLEDGSMSKGSMSKRRDHSLKMISDLSGGKYFQDVEYYETISEKIHEITGNYYVLGYYIDEKWDGKYHEIKVDIKQKGCEVYAQGGYFNPKPFSDFSEFEKQFHLLDLALSENPYFQEPLRFPLITLPCSRRKESNLVLLSELQLESIKETISGKTEMITLILDEKTNIIDSNQGEVNFSLIPKKKVYYYSIFSLQPGQYECRVVLRNLETGKGAVASSSVKILEELDSGIRIYPPLFLIPEKEAYYLKASKAQKEKEPLSLINIYPFLSNKHSPLLEELDRGVSRLLAVVRSSIINIKEPDIELSAHLIQHSSGQKTDLSVSILSAENREEVDILLIELELPEMEPGRYSLEIVAEELSTNSKSKVIQSFIIK